MELDDFQKSLLKHTEDFRKILSTPSGDWSVKGFIDVAKNIYTISVDTKVVSKIIELMMFPVLQKFSKENGLEMHFCTEQNHYPDVTFITKDKKKIALDLKSTYRKNHDVVSGFTLGAFTGYFRFRDSKKNITFPYKEYVKHYILGIIYTQQEELIDENKVYTIDDLENILSVVKDFDFIVQEKYRIAKDRPGSGNTKNMGSCVKINELWDGTGPFSTLGVKIFDDYWMNYMTLDMSRNAKLKKPPYSNLKEYLKYRNIKNI
ncbi:MAG: restriction endonuclease [Elusimicrobia bacterium]|nr:restriction endonuclease [Elusimicrobiota bacterium]